MNIKNITYLDMQEIKQIIHDMYWINEEDNNPGKYIYDNCQRILIILNKYNITEKNNGKN